MPGSNQLLKYFLNHRRLSIFQEELQLTIVWICFLALTRTLRWTDGRSLSFGAWVASLAHRSPRCRCKLCKDAPKLLRDWGANFITDWKRSFKDWWEPFCLSEDYDFYQFCYVLHMHPIMFHLFIGFLTAFLSACARGPRTLKIGSEFLGYLCSLPWWQCRTAGACEHLHTETSYSLTAIY